MELIAAQYRGRARVLQAKLFVQSYMHLSAITTFLIGLYFVLLPKLYKELLHTSNKNVKKITKKDLSNLIKGRYIKCRREKPIVKEHRESAEHIQGGMNYDYPT